jgi:hypothetical protein
MLKNKQDFKKIKYCLMVTKPTEKEQNQKILYLVGYVHKPTIEDISILKEEFMMDEEYGFCDILDQLQITLAPKNIVEKFINHMQK